MDVGIEELSRVIRRFLAVSLNELQILSIHTTRVLPTIC
jgi:hypothetical protein